MGDFFLVLYWTGPIGIGVFLMGLGVLFWGISRIEAVRKSSLSREGQAKEATSVT